MGLVLTTGACTLEKRRWSQPRDSEAPCNPLAPVWLQRVLCLTLRCIHMAAIWLCKRLGDGD